MRIGIVVDGQAEYRSIASIYDRIETDCTIFKPLFADMQPNSSPTRIVRAALAPVKIFAKKKADRIIICIDHEQRPECAPSWRDTLENAFSEPCANAGVTDVRVVLKYPMFENWLISDTTSLKEMKGRFRFGENHEKRVAPNRADSINAVDLIKRTIEGNSYNKVRDAVAIMKKFDPYRGAENSRSLRRFLRLLGCARYKHQSRTPEHC